MWTGTLVQKIPQQFCGTFSIALICLSIANFAANWSQPHIRHYNFALLLKLCKNYDRAIFECTQSAKMRPDYAPAYAIKAESLRKLRQYDSAIMEASIAIGLDSTLADAWATRGDAFRMIGEKRPAIDDSARAIQLSPLWSFPRATRAAALLDSGSYSAAIDEAMVTLMLEPWHAFNYKVIGESFRLVHRVDEARLATEIAILLDPDGWAYYNRGDIRRLQNDLQGAIDDSNKSLSFCSSAPAPLFTRGDSYRLMHKYDLAIDDCTSFIRKDQKFSRAYSTRADAYRHSGKWDYAIADCKKALLLDPDSVFAKQCLQLSLEKRSMEDVFW